MALSALGIFGAMLMIFAGLVALNHTVLPFDGWPLNDSQLSNGKQTLPRAPVEPGRLRTASGGTLAGISRGAVVVSGPGLALTVPSASRPLVQSLPRLHLKHGLSHSIVPTHRTVTVGAPTVSQPAPQPVAPQPVAAQPAPAAAPATVSPSSRLPQRTPSTAVQQHGRGHAYGRTKHAGSKSAAVTAAAPAPAAAVAAPAVAAEPPAAPAANPGGPGNGHGHAYGHDQAGQGHGPPPSAHGHH